MHPIGNKLEVLEISYTIILTVVCYGFKIVLNEKINFPNGKNEGSHSNVGHGCHSGTAV